MSAELDAQFEAILTSGQAALDKTRGIFPSQVRDEPTEISWEYRFRRPNGSEFVSSYLEVDGGSRLISKRQKGPWLPVEN